MLLILWLLLLCISTTPAAYAETTSQPASQSVISESINNDEILYRSNIFDNLEDNLISNRKDDSTKREDTIFNNEIYRKKKNTIEYFWCADVRLNIWNSKNS